MLLSTQPPCNPSEVVEAGEGLQGYLAHEKLPPPRTLQKIHAKGPMGVLGGWVFSFERGTPVRFQVSGFGFRGGSTRRAPPATH